MSKNEQKPQEGRPTPEQVAAWKKEHGSLFSIEVNGKLAILRKPRMLDLERAQQVSRKPNAKPFDFNRNIVGNCALYLDPGMRENDENELALLTSVGELVEVKEAEVKKL
ncbi:MAG TPA: hypothetical protein PKE21_13845 [Flavobacteriales bacterium]|nr:hypothetical protein [Flavobacteriales bacterium]HMR28560.1 hypothetical protein [Flavobacteriales bacterium]